MVQIPRYIKYIVNANKLIGDKAPENKPIYNVLCALNENVK